MFHTTDYRTGNIPAAVLLENEYRTIAEPMTTYTPALETGKTTRKGLNTPATHEADTFGAALAHERSTRTVAEKHLEELPLENSDVHRSFHEEQTRRIEWAKDMVKNFPRACADHYLCTVRDTPVTVAADSAGRAKP